MLIIDVGEYVRSCRELYRTKFVLRELRGEVEKYKLKVEELERRVANSMKGNASSNPFGDIFGDMFK